MFYNEIIKGIEEGLLKMKDSCISNEEFFYRLEHFKHFDYRHLSDDEIFWILTYVMFFNIGKKASMIEKKLPLFKEYLYGYLRVSQLSDIGINNIVNKIGFELQVNRCRENAKKFSAIILQYGSFKNYLEKAFNITGTHCSINKIQLLYDDLGIRFKGSGIGETSRWHFITELGFNSLKPDSVIKRIFHRLGLISDEQSNSETIAVGRNIAHQLNLPIRYIDIIFVKYGQEGSSNLLGTADGICLNNNPKCNICSLNKYCKYNKGKINMLEFENQFKDLFINNPNSINPDAINKKDKVLTPMGYLAPDEFIETDLYNNYGSKCKIFINHLFNKMIDSKIDFYVEKRKNNDIILVASSRLNKKSNKNILTIWIHSNSIDIRIMPDPTEHFYRLEDFDEAFMRRVHKKYTEIR